MVSASPIVHAAAYALLTQGAGAAALVAAGVARPAGTSAVTGGVTTKPKQGQKLPYVEVGQTTEVERDRSTETRSADVTYTCTVRAASVGQAHAVAAVVTSTLARRLDLPAPTGGSGPEDGTAPYITDGVLDLYGEPIDDGGDPPTVSIAVRTRYRVHQPASSTE